MNFKSNKILSRDFYIILAVVVCLFFIKVFTHGIVISLGGDELLKWGLANDFIFFNLIIHLLTMKCDGHIGFRLNYPLHLLTISGDITWQL